MLMWFLVCGIGALMYKTGNSFCFKKLGYRYITLDLEGLRRGSMDN